MRAYKFNHKQLEEVYQSQTFGIWEPTRILMSPRTFSQFREWAIDHINHGNEWVHTHPLLYHGATVEQSDAVRDGCVVFLGGARVLKLIEDHIND